MTTLRSTYARYMQEQRHYFERGLTIPIEFRKKMLHLLKDEIERREEDIVKALAEDLGKPAFESYTTEIRFVLMSIEHTLRELDDWLAVRDVKTPLYLQPATSYTVRDPHGLVLIISPYNYPFQLTMEPLVGSIAGGNCTIVKPSEQAPATSCLVHEMLETIFPLQYVRVIQGEVKETEALLAQRFDYMFFTGSQRVGRIVMEAAARHLTPVTLELGGKSPAIVDHTAKLKIAAERIAWGKFVNTGQTCVAPDYVLVHRSKAEALLKELQRAIVRFYGKDASKSEDYGKIAQPHHWSRLVRLLKTEQSNIAFGGQVDEAERFIAPTLVYPVTWDSPLMQEELFGPILPLVVYDELEEAVHRVNQLDKPLAAYFFSENERAIDYFTTYVAFGGGCINDTLTHVGNVHLPFGGAGPSGIGAYHGYANIETFTHEKAMMRKSTTLHPRIVYPPYKGKTSIVKSILK